MRGTGRLGAFFLRPRLLFRNTTRIVRSRVVCDDGDCRAFATFPDSVGTAPAASPVPINPDWLDPKIVPKDIAERLQTYEPEYIELKYWKLSEGPPAVYLLIVRNGVLLRNEIELSYDGRVGDRPLLFKEELQCIFNFYINRERVTKSPNAIIQIDPPATPPILLKKDGIEIQDEDEKTGVVIPADEFRALAVPRRYEIIGTIDEFWQTLRGNALLRAAMLQNEAEAFKWIEVSPEMQEMHNAWNTDAGPAFQLTEIMMEFNITKTDLYIHRELMQKIRSREKKMRGEQQKELLKKKKLRQQHPESTR